MKVTLIYKTYPDTIEGFLSNDENDIEYALTGFSGSFGTSAIACEWFEIHGNTNVFTKEIDIKELDKKEESKDE